MTKEDFKKIGILTAILLLVTFIVHPLGEFCLYDDWSFSYSLKHFIKTGKIHFSDWTSMPLITQILWGSLFTLFDGFSYTALRISTIVGGFIGIYGTYFFFLEITKDSNRTFLFSLIFLIQAVFLNFMYSFNTDVPFYTLVIWASYFFVKFLNEEKNTHYFVALIILISSILLRDIGIALAMGFAISYIFRNGINIRNLVIALIPVFLGFSAILLWKNYLISIDGLPALYNDGRERMFRVFEIGIVHSILSLAKNSLWFAAYFGVFLSPLIILKFKSIISYLKSNKIILFITSSIFLIIISLGLYSQKVAEKFSELLIHHIFGMTYWGNVHQIVDRTLIVRTYEWNIFALILGAFGISALIIVFAMLFNKYFNTTFKERKNGAILIFCISSISIYMVPLIFAGIYMKYLIFVFPFMIITLNYIFEFNNYTKYEKIFATLATVLILYFSVATTHDILAEERARWQIASNIHSIYKIEPNRIDGGICFNAWHLYSDNYIIKPDKNWWWVEDDEYMVVDGLVNNYTVISQIKYTRYLPPFKVVTMYGLKRQK